MFMDGWNVVSELDGLNSKAVKRTYLWGRDLSGSLQNAGGPESVFLMKGILLMGINTTL